MGTCKEMLTELSEEELAELKEKCEEWYIDQLSEEVKRKAEIKGRKVVKDFQMQASRDLGMLNFVLTAHRDTNGSISMSKMAKPGLSVLARYGRLVESMPQSQFADIDGSVPKESLPSKEKEKIKLPLDNNEYPILVDEDLSSLATFSDLQAIIRSFLMTYYQISTGNTKASVPWTSLAEHPGNYIN
ncbi:hypothetical protein SERLA73DRAFT_148917 [Serpula lacrymans var. lacrymans S7.3]|uniref:Uncharacterized protein n=1 Tax=Serpula lacrymans var. lacrymans (strain S7.3) TaxID=936435 RepID=F8PGP1_SERL3|nr:hypothetical protein SERLA73DRAFT_148917 [Serpula lacrymans var. lacrymans S7.3]